MDGQAKLQVWIVFIDECAAVVGSSDKSSRFKIELF
jgi:hypothetical protein